jgi:hypothetical protein
MTFSMGTTAAIADPPATASKTSRNPPTEMRSTSPNAASTASSANAPGSPAYAIGRVIGSVIGLPVADEPGRSTVISWRTASAGLQMALRVAAPPDHGLERRLEGGLLLRRGRCRPERGRGGLQLGLGGLKRVELNADEWTGYRDQPGKCRLASATAFVKSAPSRPGSGRPA